MKIYKKKAWCLVSSVDITQAPHSHILMMGGDVGEGGPKKFFGSEILA